MSEAIILKEYAPGLVDAIKRLNYEWLERYFKLLAIIRKSNLKNSSI